MSKKSESKAHEAAVDEGNVVPVSEAASKTTLEDFNPDSGTVDFGDSAGRTIVLQGRYWPMGGDGASLPAGTVCTGVSKEEAIHMTTNDIGVER